MTNKYNAQRAYWHPRCGYFKGKQALEDYFTLSKVEDSGIIKDNFQVFDSGFEADIHKLLNEFVNKNSKLVLFTQVQVDLSQPGFCNLGYRIDFCVGFKKQTGFATKNSPILAKTDNISYNELHKYIELKNSLLVEAKGVFTPESRFKHLLLESHGIRHGKGIEIVQATPQHVSRGRKCYETISPATLREILNQRFNCEE